MTHLQYQGLEGREEESKGGERERKSIFSKANYK